MNIKIKFKQENIYIAVVFAVIYSAALLMADVWLTSVAAALLVCVGIFIYCWLLRVRRCPVNLCGLLILSWSVGLGLAILRLSSLHDPWTWQTKICFGAFPVCFLLGEGIIIKRREKKLQKMAYQPPRLFICILVTAAISTLTFIAEALILGYIPIFSEDTHAYNYFHVTGLHYFTVSSMMTHALSAIFLLDAKKRGVRLNKKQVVLLAIANIISISVAIMCISKLQFLLILGLPVLILLGNVRVADFRKLPWKKIFIIAGAVMVLLVGVMVGFTLLRHYEPGYLDDIFEFRNGDIPIWIQYPYMYIANNFANFNCLTSELTEHTYGLRQLFPVFALTGTKFIWPQLVNFPLYVVKEEINTLTIIYDAYYDFGIAGVIGFGFVLGLVSSWISEEAASSKNPVIMLFFGQMGIYLTLSFFSAWFSLATTWFWFAISAIFCLVVLKPVSGKVREDE